MQPASRDVLVLHEVCLPEKNIHIRAAQQCKEYNAHNMLTVLRGQLIKLICVIRDVQMC